MGQAPWYELTPARKQLLAALVLAALAFAAMLTSRMDALREVVEPQNPANGWDR